MIFIATLKLGLPTKPFTVKAPTIAKAKRAATAWARATVKKNKHLLGDVKEHQWGFWYDAYPEGAPDSMFEAFQPIGKMEISALL